jgi:ABC-type branched-subunit amino acid transport system substrate-binding protein
MASPAAFPRLLTLAAAALLPGLACAELLIGQIAPFSGPLAPTGTQMRAGAQVYFNAINAAGGIHGQTIELVARDDGYKATETVRLTRELLERANPIALFGIVGTGNVEALIKDGALNEAGIPVVGVRTGAASVRKPVVPTVFHTRASYAQEIEAIVQQFAVVGATRLAVLYQDDPFGTDGLAGAEAAVKASGGQLVAKAAYEKNTTKVEPAVKAIAAAAPQAVILIANTAASAEFVRQSRAARNDAQFIALSVTDGPQVAKTIGNELAQGLGVVQVVPDPASRAVPVSRELQDNLKRHPVAGAEINHTLLEGYIAAKVLVEGLKRAGPNPTRRKLRDALESIRNFDVGGIVVNYSASNHAGSLYVDISVLNREGRMLR